MVKSSAQALSGPSRMSRVNGPCGHRGRLRHDHDERLARTRHHQQTRWVLVARVEAGAALAVTEGACQPNELQAAGRRRWRYNPRHSREGSNCSRAGEPWLENTKSPIPSLEKEILTTGVHRANKLLPPQCLLKHCH